MPNFICVNTKLLIHYSLHLVVPVIIAYLYSAKHWKKVYLILLATMLVDLDHLLADPIYDPHRCSIGFHPLHSYYAIGIYVIGLIPKKARIIAIGLLFHMITDQIDCWL